VLNRYKDATLFQSEQIKSNLDLPISFCFDKCSQVGCHALVLFDVRVPIATQLVFLHSAEKERIDQLVAF
jgi:hypothetical protein